MHDDTQVARVFEMKKALADGQFPVRWVSDLGYNYGYPIFNFYAPFAYYVGGFLSLAGLDALTATKIMMILGVIFAGISMYFLAREFWGKTGGVISGLLYLYAPYHAVNIYVRGAVAELWAYAFLPLAFLGVYKVADTLLKSPQATLSKELLKWVTIGAVGYAGVIVSHNLTAMMATPFLFATTVLLFFLVRKTKQKRHLFVLILPLLFGIIIAAFYWLPTLQEMHYTNVASVVGGKSDVNLHFVCPSQLLTSPWGFGGSVAGCVDGMSFKIGKVHLALTIFAFIGLAFLWKGQRSKFIIASVFFVFLLASVLLMFRESSFLWNSFPQMAFFQFPWRFLLLVSFFMSFLSGAIFFILQTKIPRFGVYGITGVIIGSILFFNASLFVPQTMLPKTATDYTNRDMLTWTTSKISDEYLPRDFKRPLKQKEVPTSKIIFQDSKARIISQQTKTDEITALIDTPNKTRASLSVAYFPAWQVFIDKEKVGYSVFNRGLYITVPAGKHVLTVSFIQTPVEVFANMLSLTGVLALLLGIIITRRKEHAHAKTKKST